MKPLAFFIKYDGTHNSTTKEFHESIVKYSFAGKFTHPRFDWRIKGGVMAAMRIIISKNRKTLNTVYGVCITSLMILSTVNLIFDFNQIIMGTFIAINILFMVFLMVELSKYSHRKPQIREFV